MNHKLAEVYHKLRLNWNESQKIIFELLFISHVDDNFWFKQKTQCKKIKMQNLQVFLLSTFSESQIIAGPTDAVRKQRGKIRCNI